MRENFGSRLSNIEQKLLAIKAEFNKLPTPQEFDRRFQELKGYAEAARNENNELIKAFESHEATIVTLISAITDLAKSVAALQKKLEVQERDGDGHSARLDLQPSKGNDVSASPQKIPAGLDHNSKGPMTSVEKVESEVDV